jgi:Ankyrin repeat
MISPAPTALPPMAREIFYALFHDFKAVVEYLTRSYPTLTNVKIIGPRPPGSFQRFKPRFPETQFGGSTPLLLAAALRNWDTVEILLSISVSNINAQNDMGNTALHHILRGKRWSIFERYAIY